MQNLDFDFNTLSRNLIFSSLGLGSALQRHYFSYGNTCKMPLVNSRFQSYSLSCNAHISIGFPQACCFKRSLLLLFNRFEPGFCLLFLYHLIGTFRTLHLPDWSKSCPWLYWWMCMLCTSIRQPTPHLQLSLHSLVQVLSPPPPHHPLKCLLFRFCSVVTVISAHSDQLVQHLAVHIGSLAEIRQMSQYSQLLWAAPLRGFAQVAWNSLILGRQVLTVLTPDRFQLFSWQLRLQCHLSLA